MDPKQSQSHLKPPPHHYARSSSSQSASPSPSPTPRAPVTAHPTATIAETTVFHGTHPISIGAGTVVHPRARIYSYEGPVIIGDDCIISEKATIGVAPTPTSASLRGSSSASTTADGIPIRLASAVSVGPSTTILPGAHLHAAVSVDALATIHRRVSVGAHSKICAGCEIAENTAIREWMVVWGVPGSINGLGQRRRVRAKGVMTSPTATAQGLQSLEGKVVEDARLMALRKEREALGRLVVPAGGAKRR
ncbi:trimeric LpxA-like protein [Aspergillus ambiguus]|uniref:transferase hexapeptide domain protein n=1 Tax=Aspergillus ambiguus TaxID=176160 RepID=UPI003CCCF15D